MSVFPNLATSIRYENVSKGFSKINKVQMKLNININERKISRKRFELAESDAAFYWELFCQGKTLGPRFCANLKYMTQKTGSGELLLCGMTNYGFEVYNTH